MDDRFTITILGRAPVNLVIHYTKLVLIKVIDQKSRYMGTLFGRIRSVA